MNTIILTAALIGVIILIVDLFRTEIITKRVYRDIDTLYYKEWNGNPADELIAWFRLRNRTLLSKKIRTVKEYIIYEEAFRTRIDQCRSKNHAWTTLTQPSGRITIISTQN